MHLSCLLLLSKIKINYQLISNSNIICIYIDKFVSASIESFVSGFFQFSIEKLYLSWSKISRETLSTVAEEGTHNQMEVPKIRKKEKLIYSSLSKCGATKDVVYTSNWVHKQLSPFPFQIWYTYFIDPFLATL